MPKLTRSGKRRRYSGPAYRGGKAKAAKYSATAARAEYLGEPVPRSAKKRAALNRRFLAKYKKNTKGKTYTKIRKDKIEVENLTKYFPQFKMSKVGYRAVAEIQVWTETDVENIIAEQEADPFMSGDRREELETLYGKIIEPDDIKRYIGFVFRIVGHTREEAIKKCEEYGSEQYQSVPDYDDFKSGSFERLMNQIADAEDLQGSKLVYWIKVIHYMEKLI